MVASSLLRFKVVWDDEQRKGKKLACEIAKSPEKCGATTSGFPNPQTRLLVSNHTVSYN